MSSKTYLGWPVWTADGTRVCYAPVNDLWCVSAAGGAPQRLMTDVLSPQFTPDGKSLLFISLKGGKRRLFASSPPGAEPTPVGGITLPDGGNYLQISPDGTKLLLGQRNAPPQNNWVIPYPSGPPIKIPSEEGWTNGSGGWFPDSRHVALFQMSSEPNLMFRLAIADTDSAARRVLNADTGWIISVAVSPDGKRIVYSTGQPKFEVGEYSMEGRRVRSLVASTGSASWSRSGDRFLYGVGESGRSMSLWIRNVDGSGASVVLSNLSVQMSYRVSPDGQRIAYAPGILEGTPGIETISLKGGRPVRIVSSKVQIGGGPLWSGDGEWLWYNQSGKIWKVQSRGGGQPQVVKDGSGALWDCSPDNRWLLVGTDQDLRLIALDGQQDRVLAKRGVYQNGRCGERGSLLYLMQQNRRRIDAVDVETSIVRRTIEFGLAPGDSISNFSIHPDGERILLTEGSQRYDLWMAEGFAPPARGLMSWFSHWDIPPAPAGGAKKQGAVE